MKRNRYVHGWKGYIQCIYGKDGPGNWKYVQPCTLREAQKVRRNMHISEQKDYRIYKLVVVK